MSAFIGELLLSNLLFRRRWREVFFDAWSEMVEKRSEPLYNFA